MIQENTQSENSLVSREQLFQLVAIEICRDGKISKDEFQFLKSFAEMLSLPVERANVLVNQVIAHFKAGTLKDVEALSPEALYKKVLSFLAEDGVIDSKENSLLDRLQALLKIPPENRSPKETEKEKEAILADGKLKPLKCKQCNGIVPLAPLAVIQCPYCLAKVEIPQAYLEAIGSRNVFDKRKQGLDDLFKKLGQRPGLFSRLLAMLPESIVFILVCAFIAFTPFPAVVYWLTYVPLNFFFSYHYQENMLDLISPAGRICLNVFPYFLAFTVPMYFLHHAKRKVVTLGQLQIALVASAPLIPGGPETCRQCGAPLEIPDNAFGVACRYCSTENLVGIPQEVTQITRKNSQLVGMDLLKAKNRYDEVTFRGLETIVSMALGYVFLSCMAILVWQQLREEAPWPPSYQLEMKSRSAIVLKHFAKPSMPLNEWNPLTATPSTRVEFFLPLRAKETFRLLWKPLVGKKEKTLSTTDSLAERENFLKASFFLEQSFSQKGMPQLLGETELKAEEKFQIAAPLGGWYRLELFTPKSGRILLFPVIE